MPGVNRKPSSRVTPKKTANKGKVGAVHPGGPTTDAAGGRLPLVLKAGQRKPVNLDEFEVAARLRMSPLAYGYVSGGAGDEHTVVANREAFAAIRLKPRVLVDVSHVDTRVTLLGQSLAHPILLAPTAYHKLSHPQGERACALGAAAAEAVMVVSSFASTAVEAIAEAAKASGALAGTTLWFQLYINPDRAFTRDLVARAAAAGCRALCLTVDSPVFGTRDREARLQFQLPRGVVAENLKALGEKAERSGHVSGDDVVYSPMVDCLTWKDVDWLCSLTKLPVLLKGILTAEDAKLAVEHGAAGIIVSNHGGRNLDTVPATIDALPGVVEAVRGALPVLLDGGIRRGTDVFKALALGANAVLIGRPYVYGLAVGGAAGVAEVVRMLRDELRAAMALCGTPTIAEITRRSIWE
jgi:4-hydroxymandelate oxidase